MKKAEGIGGLEFDSNTKEIDLFGIKRIKNTPINKVDKSKLTSIGIPGRSFGHSLWRLSVHFKNKLKDISAFSIEKYDKKNLGKEGAVRVIWWLEKVKGEK